MLPALTSPGCHIHFRNSTCAQAQNLRPEDGVPNVCGGEQQLPWAVEHRSKPIWCKSSIWTCVVFLCLEIDTYLAKDRPWESRIFSVTASSAHKGT